MRRPERVGIAVVIVAKLVTVVPCRATTRHVPAEFSTINGALDASAFGDTVLVAAGVYSDVETRDVGLGFPYTSCAFLKDGVVLRSVSGPAVTTIDMMHAPGPQPDVIIAFFLDSDATAVEGFTITGVTTAGHGAAVFFSNKVTFENCVFRDMDAGESTGAGIACEGDLAIINCEFVNCVAEAGGAIIHSGGHLELAGTTIRSCGNKGAYLLGIAGGESESAVIGGCTFLNNWSDNNSGALHISGYDAGATVIGCHFEGNTGDNDAGAIGWGNEGAKTIENCLFVNNGAVGPNAEGGAITISGSGTCIIRGNTFYGNYQADGTFGGATLEILTPTVFERNIISHSSGGTAIASSGPLGSSCNVYWMNAQGIGVPLSNTDLEADPLFCSPEVGDFTVQTDSPCVEPQSGTCGQIGAFPASCGTVAVERVSWGQIKALYR
jgi:hypothetical protein